MSRPSQEEIKEHDKLWNKASSLVRSEIEMQHNPIQPKPGWWARYKLRKALRALQRVLELNPSNDAACFLVGKIQHRFRNYDIALECFSKAHELKADNLIYLREASIVAMRLGDGHQAVKYAEIAVKTDPSNFGLYDNWALALLISGNIQEAKQKAQHAVDGNASDEISKNVFDLINHILEGKIPYPKNAFELDKIIEEIR